MEHRICIVRWKLLLLIAVVPVTLVNSSSLEPHRHSKREFVSSPKDQVVLLGGRVRLECSTSLKDPVTWHFSNGSFQGDIYYGGMLRHSMEDRYQMDTSRTGRYSLVIPRVDNGHAGQYRCDDDEGLVKGESVELTVLVRLPACTVSNRNPNNVNCSFEAAGNLEPKITCGKRARQAERKNNVYSFSEKFDPNSNQTCRVCFTKGTTRGCVFETGFEEIPESLGKTTLSVMYETPAPWVSDEEADNGTIVVAVIMTVIGVVIIAAIVVVAIKRKAVCERIRDPRRRMTQSQDPENPEDTETALNHRSEFQMSPSLSTESGNSETPLNPNGRDA